MQLDLTNTVDRVRLKIGDVSDIPYLDNSVILDSLTRNDNNFNSAVKECAFYILGILSYSGRRRLAQLEVYGSDVWSQYKDFLILLTKDPNFSGICPIPYAGGVDATNPLIQFTEDWNANYVGGTQSDLLSDQAIWSSE